MRIMTHNVWNRDGNCPDWQARGEDCSAEARVSGLLRVWRETEPDIIGGQEFSRLMAELVKEGFEEEGKNYALIWGRFTPILYRPDKLELIDTEFLTYPVNIPGYEGEFNDVRSKAVNIAVFRVKETGRRFVFATTHLWWMHSPENVNEMFPSPYTTRPGSDEAREYQIALATERIDRLQEKYDCPAVFVGDFNTGYNSKAIQYAISKGFRHARHIATDYADTTMGYHNCFAWGYDKEYYSAPFENAIDHILLRGEREGSVSRFVRYSPDYYFPISDHSAAYIDIDI